MREKTASVTMAVKGSSKARWKDWVPGVVMGLVGSSLIASGGPAEAREPSYVKGEPTEFRYALAYPRGLIGHDQMVLVAAASQPVQYQRRRTWGGAPERRTYGKGPPAPRGWFTLRGGLYNSNDVSKNDYLIGFKTTGRLSDTFWLGVSADLQRRSAYDQVRTEVWTDPLGNRVTSSVTTFAASSNLIPMMAVMDIELPTHVFRPYIGLGGGYELLVVEWEDFEEGILSRSTYGGWGWQAYGGLAIPFGELTALTGEIYLNRAKVSREVQDADTGDILSQKIDVDGEGFRLGLRLGF